MPTFPWYLLKNLEDFDFGGISFLNLLKSNFDRVLELYSILEDEESRNTLFNFDIKLTYPLSSYQQYFHPYIRPEDGDVIVDGGAFTGDTIQCIVDRGIKFREIYAFEPDHRNLEILRSNFDSDNILIIAEGLWSKEGKLLFINADNPVSSYVIDEQAVDKDIKASDYVEVTSIDTFFERREKPTFIKLDIEGGEVDAIKGAQQVISNYSPKLAVSIYHRPSDIWEIPLLINNMNPKYKFYLGHHSFYWVETIVYAWRV